MNGVVCLCKLLKMYTREYVAIYSFPVTICTCLYLSVLGELSLSTQDIVESIEHLYKEEIVRKSGMLQNRW
ncbi:hypothetical protein SAMN05421690_100267 [Nitrosomonas sp. Nm51]|nr:hypothetical protein SAMN05421690_100267 [Nitrosomonas sp. Nm51]